MEYQKLRFLIALTMTYQEYDTQKIKTNLLLIIKPYGASPSAPSICACDHEKIYELRIYFSRPNAPYWKDSKLMQITGSLSTTGVYYIGKDNNINPNDEWEKYNLFYPINMNEFKERYDFTMWN